MSMLFLLFLCCCCVVGAVLGAVLFVLCRVVAVVGSADVVVDFDAVLVVAVLSVLLMLL